VQHHVLARATTAKPHFCPVYASLLQLALIVKFVIIKNVVQLFLCSNQTCTKRASTTIALEIALNEGLELYWDSTYAIAVTLMQAYPDRSPEDVGLIELAEMVVTLPNFQDDPAHYTERILLDIQNVWYEESFS
jgi:FeS assembly protein IscX